MVTRDEAPKGRSDKPWIVVALVAAAGVAVAMVSSVWAIAIGELGTFAGAAVSVIFWYWIAAGAARRTRWARS